MKVTFCSKRQQENYCNMRYFDIENQGCNNLTGTLACNEKNSDYFIVMATQDPPTYVVWH